MTSCHFFQKDRVHPQTFWAFSDLAAILASSGRCGQVSLGKGQATLGISLGLNGKVWLSAAVQDPSHPDATADISPSTPDPHSQKVGATGLSIDTRTLCPGDLFLALTGARWDGHTFLADAIAKGANAVVVSRAWANQQWNAQITTEEAPHKGSSEYACQDALPHTAVGSAVPAHLSQSVPCFVVTDPVSFLLDLADVSRRRCQGTILALTGSSGKTTLKEALFHVLTAQERRRLLSTPQALDAPLMQTSDRTETAPARTPLYAGDTRTQRQQDLDLLAGVFATQGSLNNHLGLPLSMARMPAHTRWNVFELGMNHAGEIRTLVKQLHPHAVAVLNVSLQHGAHFPEGLPGIVAAKSEIFEACQEEIAVIPADAPYTDDLKHKGQTAGIHQWITFGQSADADMRWVSHEAHLDPVDGPVYTVCATVWGRPVTYRLPLLGTHWILNSLAVAACVHTMGGDPVQALHDMATFRPVDGRGRLLTIQGTTLIDHSYNASPAAMKAALEGLKAYREALSASAVKIDDKDHGSYGAPAIDAPWACKTAPTGRLFVALGAMRELGEETAAHHLALEPLLRSLDLNHIFLCEEEMQSLAHRLGKHVTWAPKVQDLIPHILKTLAPGDTLLIKGARSTRMFAVVDALYRYHGLVDQALAYPLRAYL